MHVIMCSSDVEMDSVDTQKLEELNPFTYSRDFPAAMICGRASDQKFGKLLNPTSEPLAAALFKEEGR